MLHKNEQAIIVEISLRACFIRRTNNYAKGGRPIIEISSLFHYVHVSSTIALA